MVTRLLERLGGVRGAVRVGVLVAGGVAASTVAVGVAFVVPTGGGGAGTANLWVDGAGSCTRQPIAGAYSDAGACSSFATAYAAASGGDRINVKAGSYGGQTITGGTKAVTIASAPGESVTVGGVAVYNTSNLTLTGESWSNLMDVNTMDVDYACNGACHGVNDSDTFSYLHSHVNPAGACSGCGGASFWRGVTNLLVQHSEFGPSNPDDAIKLWPPLTADASKLNANVTFDDIRLHDIIHTADATVHDDGFSIEQGSNVTLSRFKTWNCGTQCLYPQCDNLGPGGIGAVTIINSMVGPTQSYGSFAVNLSSGCGSTGPYTLKNNTIAQAINSDGVVPFSLTGNVLFYLGNDFGCNQTVGRASSAKYNVFDTVGCGGDATNITDTGVASHLISTGNNASIDLHLGTGTFSAVNVAGFTLANGCSSTDYDGDTRPVGASCDAGADERNP